MDTITLRNKSQKDVTIISNIFIDEYMPTANGSYVKVYLYLLRCLCNTETDLSISYLADKLDNTEKDILRALNYWEKFHLISINRTESGDIIDIILNEPVPINQETTPAANQIVPFPTTGTTSTTNTKPTYTDSQIIELTSNETLKWAMNIIELYLERPLSPSDIQLILYLYENVGFSVELIMYLYDYCVSRSIKNVSYIEKVALSWAKEGINTVEKAETATAKYHSVYNAVMKSFGFKRTPGDVEKQFIEHWVYKYQFDTDIIIEACNRTLLNIKKADFKYANKILCSWYEQGVKNLSDITALDKIHQEQASSKQTITPSVKSPNNRFHAFPQRNYTKEEFLSLEQKLLNKQPIGHNTD